MTMRRSTLAWLVLGLTAFGLLLRLPRLAWQPLWWDEGYSVYFATTALDAMVRLTARDIHPPLYYALLHGWLNLFGRSDPVTLRAFSLVWGVTAIPLIVWLARLLFPRRPGIWLCAGLLLALNPMHIYYSQEVRMYGMAMALMLAATALFWRFLQQPNWQRGLLYGVAALLCLYTLYYSALLLLAHFTWGLWSARRQRMMLGALVATGLGIFLGYLPWLLYAVPQLTAYVSNKVATDADRPLNGLTYLTRHVQTFLAGHVQAAPEAGTLGAVLTLLGYAGWLGVLIIGIGLLLDRLRTSAIHRAGSTGSPAAALTTFAVLPAGLAFLLNLRLPFFPEGGERLLLGILPFLLILLAVGIQRTWQRPYWGRVGLAALIISALAGIGILYTTPRYSTRDYRPLIGQIVQQGSLNDTILAIFPWQVGYWRAYVPAEFRQTHGPEAFLPAEGILTWGPELQRALDAALERGTVWFPEPLSFGSTLPDEIEGYLIPRSANLVNRWYSPTTRLTAWRPTSQGEPLEIGADFGPVTLATATVNPTRVASANEPVAVTLTWRSAADAKTEDYYVTFRLVDDDGRLWAARDYGPLGSLAQVDGAQIVEQVGLTVPVGLPPGSYTLAVGLGERATEALLRPATLGADVPPFQPLTQLEVGQPLAPLPPERLPVQYWLDRPLIDEGVALLGHAGATDDEPTLAGTELALRLFFQNRATETPLRHIFLSLRDRDEQTVVAWEGWPLPNYPTDAWPQDALVQVPVTFFIPPTVTTGDYTLVARLVDPANQADSPAAELGKVSIRQRIGTFDAPAMANELTRPVRFGTHVDLIGYDVTRVENTLELVLHWRIDQPLLPPHHIFAHLVSADGTTVAQADGAPVTPAGPAPSGSWLPGEYLSTQHAISLPEAWQEGSLDALRLRVGLYSPEGNIRLPANIPGEETTDAAELTLP